MTLRTASLLALAAVACFPLAAPSLAASSSEVRLALPVPAQVDLAGRSSILPLPFLVVSQEGEGRLGPSVDASSELGRYLRKVLRRETDLHLVDIGRFDYPSRNLELGARDIDFWRALGERTGADLILAGSLDFDVQERSGYVTEEVPTLDGRPYYRQVLIEQTGFELDILIQVFDGETGELVAQDNFKDFKTFDTGSADPLRGLFANLAALEQRMVGLFQQRQIQVTRTLLSP